MPATTVNRLCGSSLDAAIIGSRTIETGDADVILVGGVESMTRAPWVLPKPSGGFPAGNVGPKAGVSRERHDDFAVRSH